MQSVIQAAEVFVKQELLKLQHDASHDWWHIDRVRKMALALADQEGIVQDDALAVIELAAILHDVQDWKYSGRASANEDAVQAFLQACHVDVPTTNQIISIIGAVGFKDELGAAASRHQLTPEAAVVQDADRLDAMGAIGIARCFTFGGRFQRVLHDPAILPRIGLTKEEYMSSKVQQTTINHFHEKLLKLKGMIKSKSGQQIAAHRHAFMEQYLQQFQLEWNAQA